jgi:hypothetical protein
MAAGKQYLAVSKRALVQRINRQLRKQDEKLKGARGANAGEYRRVDTDRNFLIEEDVDLEALGRELGVLAAYERLEED